MSDHSPVKPEMTVEQLQEDDFEAYEVLMEFLFQAARNAHLEKPDIGLEAVLEDTISLYNKGYIKLLYDEEAEYLSMGVFNPLTGKYYSTEQAVDGA